MKLKSMYLSFNIVCIIAILFIGTVGIWGMNKITTSVAAIVTSSEALQAATLGDMMHDALRADVLAVSLAVEHADLAALKTAQNDIETHAKKLEDNISTVSRLTASSQVKETLKAVQPKLESYIAAAKEIGNIASVNQANSQPELHEKGVSDQALSNNQAHIKAVNNQLPKFLNTFSELETELGVLGEHILAFNKTSQTEGVDIESIGKKLIIIGTLLISLSLIFLAWYIQQRRMASLGAEPEVIRDVANVIAKGDLSQNIIGNLGGSDSLFGAMQTMQNNLRNLISQIQISADSISSGAQQISAGNTDLSSRTEQQASNLEETASSMEEMASTVKQNAENAKQANLMARETASVAVKGGAVVGEVVTTMAEINDSSKKIVDIISVIDGIAFQTNILALNAAVEAARAGEQGRGFAVVAAEVRNLAQRSAAAAKEIKQLIGDSVEKVAGGTQLVGEAGKTMEEIVNSVKKVTDIVSEIAAASQEQSAGIDQVNNAITQMDEVTQQNAALVEEAAAAASSLESKAQDLTEATNRFNLGDSHRTLGSQQSKQQSNSGNGHDLNEIKAARTNELPSANTNAGKRLKAPKAKADEAKDWEEF